MRRVATLLLAACLGASATAIGSPPTSASDTTTPALVGFEYLNGPFVWVGDVDKPVAQVVLDAPAEGDTAVSVLSSSPDVVVPGQVTVPAGSTTAAVPVTANAAGTSTLTATLGADTVTATPDLEARSVATPTDLDALVVEPSSVPAGTTAAATVTLDFLAPAGGVSVSITSAPTGLVVPAQVTVPADQYRTTFDVPTSVDGEGEFLITGTVGDVTRSASLLVTPPDADGDGIVDADDRCPDLAGSAADGCPEVSADTSLSYRASVKKFHGKVATERACRSGRRVTIFRVRSGADARIGVDTTSRRGTYTVVKRAKRGRYYAKVAVRTVTTATCLADRSPTIRVRRPGKRPTARHRGGS